MDTHEPVNILMVDNQPGKLLSYEVMLSELGENLIKAGSRREALEHLLKTDIAVVLMDVSMPEIDGFELATRIRQHPCYQQTAIIFTAVHLTEHDLLKGYEYGAVDYLTVPIMPGAVTGESPRVRRSLPQDGGFAARNRRASALGTRGAAGATFRHLGPSRGRGVARNP
jgi:CheY-like chemotaxis protein